MNPVMAELMRNTHMSNKEHLKHTVLSTKHLTTGTMGKALLTGIFSTVYVQFVCICRIVPAKEY